MKDTTKVSLAIVGTALVVGGGGAIAAGGGSKASSSPGSRSAHRSLGAHGAPVFDAARPAFAGRGHGGPGGPGGLDAAATYLGLTEDALHTQLENGKTLAQVAQAQGKSVSGLEDALVAAAKSHLDADVAAGRITAAQETQLLADIQSHVADFVNGTLPPRDHGGHHDGHHGGHFLDAAATYLGLTEDALHAQLRSGKTLAQVAQAQGKTVSGLENAIVAAAKTHLDADVAAGRIAAAQETQMLADLKSHVADIVTGKAPKGPPPGAPGMGPRMHAPAARAAGAFN